MGMMYRVRQFWAAVRTNPLDQEDLTPAKRILTEEQMALFSRLQPSEQVHTVVMIAYLVKSYHGDLCPGDDAAETAFFAADGLPPIAFSSHHAFIRLYFAAYAAHS